MSFIYLALLAIIAAMSRPPSPQKTRKGFNLIEAAIVLGVVGLVIGGIWIAAATVSENLKAKEMQEGLLQITNGVKNFYTVSPPISDAAAPNSMDLTDLAISSGAVPSGWVSGSSIKHPFGGNIFVRYTNKFGGFFYVIFDNISQAACMKVMMVPVTSKGIGDGAGTAPFNGDGYREVVFLGSVSETPNVMNGQANIINHVKMICSFITPPATIVGWPFK